MKKRKRKRPKGPNPLSVKKSSKTPAPIANGKGVETQSKVRNSDKRWVVNNIELITQDSRVCQIKH